VTHSIFNSSTSSMISVCSFHLGTHPLDRLGVVRESPRLWWTSESLYCPLLRRDLIVETELDLGDRLEWISVERDPALCELHNGDVGILCGWLNFGRNLVSLCLSF
jgi:hypothetical protein